MYETRSKVEASIHPLRNSVPESLPNSPALFCFEELASAKATSIQVNKACQYESYDTYAYALVMSCTFINLALVTSYNWGHDGHDHQECF